MTQLQLHRLPGTAQRLDIRLAVHAVQRIEQELLADLDPQPGLELGPQGHRRGHLARHRRHALAEPEHLAVAHHVQAAGQRDGRPRRRLRTRQPHGQPVLARRVPPVVADTLVEGAAIGEARRKTAAALAEQPFVHGLEQVQADAPVLEATLEVLLPRRHPLADVRAPAQRRDHRAGQQAAGPHQPPDAPADAAQVGADTRRPLRRDPRDRQHDQHRRDRPQSATAAPVRRDQAGARQRGHPHHREREGLRRLRQPAAPQPAQPQAQQHHGAVDEVGALGHEVDQQPAAKRQQQRRQRRQHQQRPLLSARPGGARGRHRQQHRDAAREREQGPITAGAEEHPGPQRGTADHAGGPAQRHGAAACRQAAGQRSFLPRRRQGLAALHRPQQRALRHAQRHRQVDAAREGRQRGVEGQQQHRQRAEEAQRAALPHRPQQRERQAQRERAIQRRAADIHLPEQRGGPVVGREVQQPGVDPALPQRAQRGGQQHQHPGRAGQALHRRGPQVGRLLPQRQQQQHQEEALARAQAVHRLLETLPEAGLHAAGMHEAAPHRDERRQREDRHQHPHRGAPAQRAVAPWHRLVRGRLQRQRRVTARRHGKHDQVQFLEGDPAGPGREADRRHQRRHEEGQRAPAEETGDGQGRPQRDGGGRFDGVMTREPQPGDGAGGARRQRGQGRQAPGQDEVHARARPRLLAMHHCAGQ